MEKKLKVEIAAREAVKKLEESGDLSVFIWTISNDVFRLSINQHNRELYTAALVKELRPYQLLLTNSPSYIKAYGSTYSTLVFLSSLPKDQLTEVLENLLESYLQAEK